MAKNVAMNTVITLQKSALEKTQKTLAEVSEKIANLQSAISWEGCDAFEQYYDSQDELKKDAVNREKEGR